MKELVYVLIYIIIISCMFINSIIIKKEKIFFIKYIKWYTRV